MTCSPASRFPRLTQFVIGASETVQHNLIPIVGGIIVLVVGYNMLGKTAKGAIFLDNVKLKAPLFGDLTRKAPFPASRRTLRYAGHQRCAAFSKPSTSPRKPRAMSSSPGLLQRCTTRSRKVNPSSSRSAIRN